MVRIAVIPVVRCEFQALTQMGGPGTQITADVLRESHCIQSFQIFSVGQLTHAHLLCFE